MSATDTPRIIIGTTPTIRVTLEDGVDFSNETVIATITQGSRVSAISGDRIEFDDGKVLVCLEQRDTIHFNEGEATLQLNWVYQDGARGAVCQIPIELLPNDYKKVMSA